MSATPGRGLPDGVSMTALGVAWVRALESGRPDRLFHDPLAARFVEASGWNPPDLAADSEAAAGETARTLLVLAQSVIIRTKFLDDLLASAWADGTRQVVILGAGLDTRAYRLPWPPGSRCFELDLPPVLDFKAEVLARAGAVAACDRIAIPLDLLADDWPGRLGESGFRPEEPAVWVAEGLLIYFSQAENDGLLAQLGTLAGAGHRLAITTSRPDRPLRPSITPDATGRGLLHDPDAVIALWRWDGPADPVGWLGGHGWKAEVYDREERAAAYGRPLAIAADPSAATRTLLIDARRE